MTTHRILPPTTSSPAPATPSATKLAARDAGKAERRAAAIAYGEARGRARVMAELGQHVRGQRRNPRRHSR